MKTVFILEPDAQLIDEYAAIIASDEVKVIKFRSSNTAIKAIEKIIPDLIVMELALPGHNGFEFLYELRSYSDTRRIKVIINSLLPEATIPWSHVNREDFGIVDYFYKPTINTSNLRSSINAYI